MSTPNQRKNLYLSMALVFLLVVMTWAAFFAFCRYDAWQTMKMYTGRQAAVLSLSSLALNELEKKAGALGMKMFEGAVLSAGRSPEILSKVKHEHEIPVDERIMVGYGNMIVTFNSRPVLVAGPLQDKFHREDDFFVPDDAKWNGPMEKLTDRLKDKGESGAIISDTFIVDGKPHLFTALYLPNMPHKTVVFLYADENAILGVYGYFRRQKGFAVFATFVSVLAVVCGFLLNGGLRMESRLSAELKQTAEELRTQIENRKLAEKLQEELQQQLVQAQKMEAVGGLAGGIAHDFNNMLTVIMGNAELGIMREKSKRDTRHVFDNIIDASMKARNLTMKLLTLSRKEKLNVQVVSVNVMIMEMINVLKRSVNKKIKISENLKDDISPVAVDTAQLEQALLNIAMNAYDSMEDGGLLHFETTEAVLDEELRQTEPDTTSGTYCRIRISDTGEGISPENLQKILEPFFTTKERGRGTGLGLPIAHRIIKSHGGFIRMTSVEGEGTTVDIYLPTSEGGEIEAHVASEADEIPEGKGTILVADDESEVLELVVDILANAGYNTLSVTSSSEAIEIFRSRKDEIDMVLLDWNMPEMNGTDVYRELVKIQPDVKVLLASGYSEDGKAGELLGEGVKYFVQKPFRVSELNEAVRRAMED